MIIYCESGILNEVKQYYESHKDIIDIHYDEDYMFKYCCSHGFLTIAIYLFDMAKRDTNNLIDIKSEDNYAFKWSCINGHLNVAIWLYELGKKMNTPIDIHTNSETIFIYTCMMGHYNIAEWLYYLGIETNSPIDIHASNDSAFVESCRKRHYRIMEWLYNLGKELNSPIDIRAYDDYAFINACNHHDIHIARFLAEKCDYYILETDDVHVISFYVTKVRDIIEGKSKNDIADIVGIKIKNEYNEEKLKDCCPICYDDSDVKIKCGHTWCFWCFVKWYVLDDNSRNCVLCKKYFAYGDVVLYI